MEPKPSCGAGLDATHSGVDPIDGSYPRQRPAPFPFGGIRRQPWAIRRNPYRGIRSQSRGSSAYLNGYVGMDRAPFAGVDPGATARIWSLPAFGSNR